MSNMDMLLQAAEFLETRKPGVAAANKTRVENNASVHGFVKGANKERVRTTSNSSTGSHKSTDESKNQRRPGGAGTREVHNKLEKNRRAHLKVCFEQLKQVIPNLEDRKSSNLSILRLAIRHIQYLKRKEKEFELETQKLARDKIIAKERIATLRRELAQVGVEVDLTTMVKEHNEDAGSDSTATADDDEPIISDGEDDLLTLAADQAASKIMPPPPAPPAAVLHKVPVISSNANKVLAPKADMGTASLNNKQMTSLIQLAAKPAVMVPTAAGTNSPGSIAVSPAGAKLNLITTPIGAAQPGLTAGGTQQAIVLNSTVLNKSSASNVPGGSGPTLTLSVAPGLTTTSNTTGLAAQKPAVAQLLQQQIQQRVIQQQLQQFQQLQQQQKVPNGQPQGTVITLQGNNNLKPLTQLPRGVAVNSVVQTIVPGTSILAAAAAQANVPTTPTTPTGTATAQATVNKLLTTSVAGNVMQQPSYTIPSAAVAAAGSTTTTSSTAPNGLGQVQHQQQQQITNNALPALAVAATTAAPATASAPAVSFTNIKPVTQIPIQLISPAAAAQMATLQQLVNQAVNLPRGGPNGPTGGATTLMATGGSVTGSGGASSSAASTSALVSTGITRLPNIQQQQPHQQQPPPPPPPTPQQQQQSALNMTPVLSPVILSPSILAASGGLNQTSQLGQVSTANVNIVNSPLLKSLGQIPIIQQPLTISPAGVVKPVVMVTMPNVVTTATATVPSTPTASANNVP